MNDRIHKGFTVVEWCYRTLDESQLNQRFEDIEEQYFDNLKRDYDYILLDCMPSLRMLTINALAAADSVLIPVQAQYLCHTSKLRRRD